MKKNVLFIILAISILIIGICFSKKNKVEIDKIKSVNLSTDYEIEQVLEDIKDLGVNTVNVPVVIQIPNIKSNDMKIDDYSKQKAIKLIKILKKKDIKVILEAYPWINNGSSYETEYNPLDKEKFFKDWKIVLNTLINDIANKHDVDIIITGSNLQNLEKYEDNWCDIIEFVKEKFDRLVTYKTSWWYTASWDDESIDRYNKKLNNKLFSKVDFISIASYFELSDKAENTVEELVSCLSSTTIHNRKQNVVKEIYNFHKKYNKEIFFGELGFPRKDYAAKHPWDAAVSNVENAKEQSRCFKAYKEIFEDKDYLKGFSVFAVGQRGKDKNFYPSNESIDVIYSWYNK